MEENMNPTITLEDKVGFLRCGRFQTTRNDIKRAIENNEPAYGIVEYYNGKPTGHIEYFTVLKMKDCAIELVKSEYSSKEDADKYTYEFSDDIKDQFFKDYENYEERCKQYESIGTFYN